MTSGALEGDPHPFFVSTDLVQSARSKLSQGDYNSAIIDAATGIEAYVHAFAKLDMESRKVPQDKISGRLRSSFRNVVEKHFANRLGLSFDPDQPSNSVDVWYSSAYKLRNKVVHEGRTATRSEARKAVNETLDFLDLTAQCVKNNLGEFSEIWKYLR